MCEGETNGGIIYSGEKGDEMEFTPNICPYSRDCESYRSMLKGCNLGGFPRCEGYQVRELASSLTPCGELEIRTGGNL